MGYFVGYGEKQGHCLGQCRVRVSYFIIHRFVIHVERYTCWTVIHVGAPGTVV